MAQPLSAGRAVDEGRARRHPLVTRLQIHIEGAGPRTEQKSELRRAFSKLFQRAGLDYRSIKIVAGGGRDNTLDDFESALRASDAEVVAVLVDSETTVADVNRPWAHLCPPGGRKQPVGTTDQQAFLMITSMETWIAADRQAVGARF